MDIHERQKINIELLFTGDGRTFLNFWNFMDGDDVIAELIEGELMQDKNDAKAHKINLQQFIDNIDKSYNK